MVAEAMVASISTLASFLNIAVSVRQLKEQYNIDTIQAIKMFMPSASEQETELLNLESTVELLDTTQIISMRVLLRLLDELEKCEERWEKSYEDATSEMEKDDADVKMSSCICNLLRKIKRWNGGDLPKGEPYEKMWLSHRCPN